MTTTTEAAKPHEKTDTLTPEVGNIEFIDNLVEHINAGYQILYIHTAEESRVTADILKASEILAGNHGENCLVGRWDCVNGIQLNIDTKENMSEELVVPGEALRFLLDTSASVFNDAMVLWVFNDLDDFYQTNPLIRRMLKTINEGKRLYNRNKQWPLIIVSAELNIPEKLKSVITVLEYNLPKEEDFINTIDYIEKTTDFEETASDDLKLKIAGNLLGLTSLEGENCLARCIVKHGPVSDVMIPTIKEEKANIIKTSQVLTYIPEDTIATREEIAGYDNYLEWLDRRKLAYTHAAREQNIDYPKGCVLIGVPGTGKSIMAKATCALLDLPGYVLDIGTLFGSLVGESEQRTRDMLRKVDAQNGCVLIIDEADKALGNAHNAQGDSGVTNRVFGTILTWLAENKSRTFCIMTLNKIDGLPPELTRAGRFDSIFFTDIPDIESRRKILEIHFKIRGVDINDLALHKNDWDEILDRTEGYVGSEIEEIVRESRYIALETTGSGLPKFEHLIQACNEIVPMTKSNTKAIEQIRNYCASIAKPVAKQLAHPIAAKNNFRQISSN